MLRRTFLHTGLLTAGVLTSNSLVRGEESPAVCPAQREDDLWIVSSRGFGCVDPSESNRATWQVQHRDACSAWQTTQLADLQAASQDGLHTVVYVHGNRNDWNWAYKNGMTVYHALLRQAPAQPFRFIIYSWPSDQIRGPVRDGRFKLQVANTETYRFGWCLSQLCAAAQYGLIGFSLGGRIITGGMHLLAGGALHGKTIAAASRPATRAVLWAPAVNHDWLAPGRYHGQALNALDRLSLMYNTNDPVMKRYHLGEPGGHPIALGFQGFASLCQLGEAAERVEHQDAAACVGKSHELVRYCAVESIMQNARKQVFWQA